MSKAGENNALANQSSTLQNISGAVSAFEQQYNQLGLPALETLFPELMNTVQGAPSPLTSAAEAPVQAATSSALANAQEESSGLTNPDQLYQNIAQSGQQQAGLAADQVVLGSLGDLGTLISGQQGLVSGGLQDLQGVANSYGQIAQQEDPWSAIASLVSGAAQAYGAVKGSRTPTSATPSTPAASSTPTTSTTQSLSPSVMQALQNLVSTQSTTPSQPSSQIAKPASTQPTQYGGGYYSPSFAGA
jgi:hypothetical protein